mgnify:CR=1 FL=1|tara:strand:- start:646 stop:1332 length:687 start_codon:yes stop_codon:yes gene_type:complete
MLRGNKAEQVIIDDFEFQSDVDTVLILTHKEHNVTLLPHLEWLKKTNPAVRVEVIVGEDHPEGKVRNWKNGDVPLREWWKKNSHSVDGEVIAVVEWDTLVSCKLPALPAGYDLVGKRLYMEDINMKGVWQWYSEIPLLELQDGETACGLVSFGFFIMRRQVLDSVCLPRWDSIYDKSIQNELRFPTIASVEGAKVGEIPLPNVGYHEVKFTGNRDIYHGVKNVQDFEF